MRAFAFFLLNSNVIANLAQAQPSAAAPPPPRGRCYVRNPFGPPFFSSACSLYLAAYTFNIPKCIPSGEYLLRIQSLGIHNPGSTPQFYVSCAQVNVVGGGSASPTPTCEIPGFVKATDPGYTANVSCRPCLPIPGFELTRPLIDLQQLPFVHRPWPVRGEYLSLALS